MNSILARSGAGIAALGILAGTLAGCSSTSSPAATSAPTETQQSTATAQSTATQTATQIPTSFTPTAPNAVAAVVKKADPAIVRIESSSGVGTGFIVSADGDIITNAHVVTGRTGRIDATVKVTLTDGTVLTGVVRGADARADIALVDIDGSSFQPLVFDHLADVYVGQDVVAIGYALDLQGGEGASYTVTRGIVSAKNRATSESSSVFGAVQTDAAINHGNSGGPLLDLDGNVVGVNTSLAPDPESAGGTASGIGFAVGSDMAKAVYQALKATGKVNRGFLGIGAFKALQPATARQLGLPSTQTGVWLTDSTSVSANTAAARAGLQAGDVITKLGNSVVKTESDLAVALIENQAGQTVPVEIFRNGQQMTLQVTLGTPTG